MKALLLAPAAALLLGAGSASAATWQRNAYGWAVPAPVTAARSGAPFAGRPRLDDGTGYTGPGTLTGGPVGGLPDRN